MEILKSQKNILATSQKEMMLWVFLVSKKETGQKISRLLKIMPTIKKKNQKCKKSEDKLLWLTPTIQEIILLLKQFLQNKGLLKVQREVEFKMKIKSTNSLKMNLLKMTMKIKISLTLKNKLFSASSPLLLTLTTSTFLLSNNLKKVNFLLAQTLISNKIFH